MGTALSQTEKENSLTCDSESINTDPRAVGEGAKEAVETGGTVRTKGTRWTEVAWGEH